MNSLRKQRSSLFFILLGSFIFYVFPYLISSDRLSPDDMIYDFFSKHLSENTQIGYRPGGDLILNRKGFVPRYFVYSSVPSRQGEAYPRKFPGFIISWGVLRALTPFGAGKLINPLCGTISLLMIYLCARIFYPQGPVPVLAAGIAAINPVLIHRTYMYNPTVFNLLLVLITLHLALKTIMKGGSLRFILLGLAAGWLLWTRPTNLIYLAGIGSLLAWERKKIIQPRGYLITLGVLLGCGVMLLIYNRQIYGSLFSLGYTVTHQAPQKIMGVAAPLSIARIFDYLRFHPQIWLSHLKNIPLTMGLAFPLLPLALGGLASSRIEPDRPRFSPFYWTSFILAVAFFSNFGTFGHESGEMTLHSSFLRYLLPIIILLAIPAADLLDRLQFQRQKVFCILIGLCLIVAILSPGGMVETITQSAYYHEVKSFILNNTDEESVIFSHYWDKSIYPERMVYTSGTQLPQEGVGNIVEEVLAAGLEAWTTSHPCDELIRQEVQNAGLKLEARSGPKLTGILRLAAGNIPPHLYPITLYRISLPIPPPALETSS